jgi:hypothetical protein
VANLAIDVPLPDRLKQYLEQPHCLDLALPKPSKVEVCLPLGGRLKGMVDATKAIPDDCSLTFSLLLQLGPIMASIECLLKVLKLIKPLIDLVKSLGPPPDLIKLGKSIPDFLEAAKEVVPCFLQIQLGVPMFVRDLLLLIAKTLHCIAGQLKSIAGLMGGIQLSIQTAQQNGNGELLAQLQCAQENASNSAAAAMSSLEPISTILSLAGAFLDIAGVKPIVLPTGGSVQDAQALETTAETLLQVSEAMITVAQALPGCA